MSAPVLLTVAHGTRVRAGNRVAATLTARASRRLGVPAATSYVELSEPLLSDTARVLDRPVVAVPLLLSTGHHVRHDLPTQLARARVPVRLARPLGPHPLLAEVGCLRLRAAGAHPGQPVVLVAAGSRDPDAAADLDSAGRLLQARWGGPVLVATVSGNGPDVATTVAEAARRGPVAVAPYLLATGSFSQRTRALAVAGGATVVADVLGPHPLVAELVVRRYRAAAARARTAA